MKKTKNILTLGAACLLLAGCGGHPSNAESKKVNGSKNPVVVSKEQTTSKNSSNKSSSSSSSTSKEIVAPSTVDVTKKDKPYKIFSQTPEMKFYTEEGSDLTWATTPNKDSDKPEVAGFITTSGVDGKEGLKNEPGKMKVRGNYTSNYTKKPFRIKFDSKKNLFGLNKGNKFKKWVLLADVKDSSMLRTSTAFYLAQKLMPSTVFVPDFTPVHLYLNDQYWGMYMLTDQKEANQGRVDIKVPADGYSGTDIGYFFELDNYYSEEEAKGADGDPTFTVDYKPTLVNQHHKFENFNHMQSGYTVSSDITNRNTQLPYIKKRVEMAYQVIYDAVVNHQYKRIENEQLVADNSDTLEECLAKTIDIDSFVGMYMLHEIVVDPDIGYSSFYLSLDMSETGNHLLTLNNPWDFDSTLGVRVGDEKVKGQQLSQEAKDLMDGKGAYASVSSNMWFSVIAKAPFFQERIKTAYQKLKDDGVFDEINGMLDDYANTYVNDYSKNFQKWTDTIGQRSQVNYEVVDAVKSFTNEGQAKNFLKQWIGKRVSFLDSYILNEEQGGGGGTIDDPQAEFDTFKASATKLPRLEAETGTIYNPEGSQYTAGVKVNPPTGEGFSGTSYVNNMNNNPGSSVTLTYNASHANFKVLFTVGLASRTAPYKFSDLFTMTINGKTITPADITIPAGTNDFHNWTSVDVAFDGLLKGENTIVITSNGTCTNLDYVDMYESNQ